jgi:hypothetical protein
MDNDSSSGYDSGSSSSDPDASAGGAYSGGGDPGMTDNQPPGSPGAEPGLGGYDPPASGQPDYGTEPPGYTGQDTGTPPGQPPYGGQQPGFHQPGGYDPGSGAQPPYDYSEPRYSPPPKKGGFNWLACCGIGCGVMLLVTIAICVIMWKVIAPFVGMGVSAGKVAEDIQKTDFATVEANATEIDSATLVASPEAYAGKWLAVTGELDDDSAAQGNNMGQQGTGYVTTEMLIISDLSNTPRVGTKGDWVTAYGKIVVMDFAQVPWLKKMIEEEAAKNPDQPTPTKIVMLFAKKVELYTEDGGEAAEEAPVEEEAAPADEEAAPEDASATETEGLAESGG